MIILMIFCPQQKLQLQRDRDNIHHHHDSPNDYSYDFSTAKTPTTKRWWRGHCRKTALSQALLWLEILFGFVRKILLLLLFCQKCLTNMFYFKMALSVAFHGWEIVFTIFSLFVFLAAFLVKVILLQNKSQALLW